MHFAVREISLVLESDNRPYRPFYNLGFIVGLVDKSPLAWYQSQEVLNLSPDHVYSDAHNYSQL
jgi:hypothetical protein